jgi:hypothetical protein
MQPHTIPRRNQPRNIIVAVVAISALLTAIIVATWPRTDNEFRWGSFTTAKSITCGDWNRASNQQRENIAYDIGGPKSFGGEPEVDTGAEGAGLAAAMFEVTAFCSYHSSSYNLYNMLRPSAYSGI